MNNNAIVNSLLRQSLIHLRFKVNRIISLGIFTIIKKIIAKFIMFIFAIILFPLSCLFFLCGYRRLNIFTDRIGHLAIEPDTLLKAQKLGLIKVKRWFVLAPPNRVANQHMLKYWDPYLTIIRSKLACQILHCLSYWPFICFDVTHFVNQNNKAQMAYHVYALWRDRKPLLKLSEDDLIWGNMKIKELGIPKEAWFVCIHSREPGFSPVDEMLHSHRNSNIHNLYLAIDEIVKRGGWVIRLGDPSMTPMKMKMPQVIDYAHHDLRSQRLDIILCAQARFILGNTSGISIVGTVFGVPCALANMIPMPTLGFGPYDLSIPKLYKWKNEQKYLSFKEIMNSSISTFRYATLYVKSNVEIEENCAEDILGLTIEMFQRLSKAYIEKEEDINLFNQYLSLFQPQHYAYGAASKIAFCFLSKYKNILLTST